MKIFATLLLFLCVSRVHAQEAITAAGTDAIGFGGSASYSVGQVCFIETGTTASVSQGVQQSYQIPFVTIAGINLRLSIYPNPATDILYVEVKNMEYPGLQYQLYDINGRLLASKKAVAFQTCFIMAHFVAGTYILQVSQNNQQVKSFTILKN